MLQGVATSHMAPAEDGTSKLKHDNKQCRPSKLFSFPSRAELIEACKAIGEETLKFLSVLKIEKPGSGKIASGANDLQKSIRVLQRNANVSDKGCYDS